MYFVKKITTTVMIICFMGFMSLSVGAQSMSDVKSRVMDSYRTMIEILPMDATYEVMMKSHPILLGAALKSDYQGSFGNHVNLIKALTDLDEKQIDLIYSAIKAGAHLAIDHKQYPHVMHTDWIDLILHFINIDVGQRLFIGRQAVNTILSVNAINILLMKGRDPSAAIEESSYVHKLARLTMWGTGAFLVYKRYQGYSWRWAMNDLTLFWVLDDFLFMKYGNLVQDLMHGVAPSVALKHSIKISNGVRIAILGTTMIGWKAARDN